MSNQWRICESCVQRHCNKQPVQVTLTVGKTYRCPKYRKHQTGWKLKEVMHRKERQR
jgi:hypothetical protein